MSARGSSGWKHPGAGRSRAGISRLAGSRRQAAFTLIEILVTVVILSTGIVAVLRAFESSVAGLAQSRNVLFGTMLARLKLTELEASLRAGRQPGSGESGRFEVPFGDYRWTVKTLRVDSVKHDDGEERMGLYQVLVTVWRDGAGDYQTLATYLRQ